jgi:chromate transporter
VGASLVHVAARLEPHLSVSLRTLCALFLKVGLSFGAGTGMSAVLLDELVYKRRAIARSEFMAIYGLARLVPSGSMTALAVAIGYRYQGLLGTFVVLTSMILPSFTLTVVLTVAYTLISNSPALRLVNLTLIPAALAIVIVSAFGLGREYFKPSLELVLIVAGAASVLFFGLNPSLVLLAGGAIGAIAIRDEPQVAQ